MFYPFTIDAIRSRIFSWSSDAKPKASEPLYERPAPLSHILWMCDEMENLPTDSLEAATEAGRRVGWMLAQMEAFETEVPRESWEYTKPRSYHHEWSHQDSLLLIGKDVKRGFDKPHPLERLGVDFGYVISSPRDGFIRMSEDEHYLERPMIDGVMDALQRLAKGYFGRQIWIVSKCSEKAEPRIMHLLDHWNFWDYTRIKRENVRFCRERADKALICQELGITHFVDDRLEVLHHMTTVPHKYALCPRNEESERQFITEACGVKVVSHWNEVVKDILPD